MTDISWRLRHRRLGRLLCRLGWHVLDDPRSPWPGHCFYCGKATDA